MKTQSDSKFKAVEQNDLIWLHVSKFKPQLSSMELESYLKLNLDSEDIIVKKFTRNYEKALFSSFKIGAPSTLTEKLFCENTWFEGIKVSEFKKKETFKGTRPKSNHSPYRSNHFFRRQPDRRQKMDIQLQSEILNNAKT